jgi:uncharacterized protein with PIN domain
MITAVDSSVLWAIIKQESGHESWLEALSKAASEGPLIICPIAFAELADRGYLRQWFPNLQLLQAA